MDMTAQGSSSFEEERDKTRSGGRNGDMIGRKRCEQSCFGMIG